MHEVNGAPMSWIFWTSDPQGPRLFKVTWLQGGGFLEKFSWLKSWGISNVCVKFVRSESSGWKKMMIDDTLIHFESAQKGSNFTVYSKLKSCQDARVPCKQQRFTHNRPFLHVMFSNSTWFWLPNNGMCSPKKTSILRQVKISQQQTPTWKTLKPSLALYLAGAAGGLKGPGRSKMGFSKSSRTNPFESQRQNDGKCP